MSGFEVCITVADLEASKRFYSALGFTTVDSSGSGAVVMAFEGFRLGLYVRPLVDRLLVFRGGNIQRIAERAKSHGLVFEQEPTATEDGSTVALLRDPDGNAMSFVSGA